MIRPYKTWYGSAALWLGTASALVAVASILVLLRQYHDRIVALESELAQGRERLDDTKSLLANEKKENADRDALVRQEFAQKLESQTIRAAQAERLAQAEKSVRQSEAASWSRDRQALGQKLESQTRRAAQAESSAQAEKSALQAEATRLSGAQHLAPEKEIARNISKARPKENRQNEWCVARLRNQTTFSIDYQLIDHGGTYKDVNHSTLGPQSEVVHTMMTCTITIRFDSSRKSGYQEARIMLRAHQVSGHRPDVTDKRNAPLNYFRTPNGVDIELH